MGRLKKDCDTNVVTAITYKTADDYTDEQVLALFDEGKSVTDLPLILGIDGAEAYRLSRRALDGYLISDIAIDQKITFRRMKKIEDEMTQFMHEKVLAGEITIKESKDYMTSLRDRIDTINRTFSTQADVFTKVPEVMSREFVKVCEQAAFVLLDKWDGKELDAAQAKEEFVEILGRIQ